MKSFSTDFSTALANHDDPVTFAVIKMPSGDVYIADAPHGVASGLTFDCIDIIENISEENDGSSLESYFSPGNLETGKLTINLLYSDKSSSIIHGLINEGISRRRVEVWKWFVDPTTAIGTCDPLLWNIYAIQDNSEGFQTREDRQLFPIELITLPASENRKLSVTSKPEVSYDFVIGKAEGLQLKLIEDESDNWTQLLGDQDGNEIDDEYTGLIRVEDATKLSAGEHLINGEQVTLARASAGYMELTARAQNSTGAQEHSNGSRMFSIGSVFKYATCAGPVGSFDLLRTSNEIDIYDEDGDLDVEEYRDLYSGGNEELHPELNPAQIWFNDRMPYLKKDQDYAITDKVFYGSVVTFSDAIDIQKPSEINRKNGATGNLISFRRFSNPAIADYWYKDTDIPLPSIQGDGSGASTYAASDNMGNGSGYFEVTQSFGAYNNGYDSTAYREFRVNSSCPPGEEGWTMIEPVFPVDTEFMFTAEKAYWAIIFQHFVTNQMSVKLEIIEVDKNGAEFILHSETRVGELQGVTEWYPLGYTKSQQFINITAQSTNARVKFKVTCLANGGPNSYAYIRIGGPSVYSDTLHYGMAAFWKYYDTAPTAWVESSFNRTLFTRGDFVSAKARIIGTARNTEDKADGTLKIYDGAVEKHSQSITDGDEIDVTIDLDAASWIDLTFSTVRVEVTLDYALIYGSGTATGIPRTDGSAGIQLSDGIQWLISYDGNNLDGIQVNYTDQLYVDATSSRGADWTPARGVQYIAEDYTNWSDIINTVDFDARHAEYQAAGHYLNGTVSGSTGAQDAIRAILKEGLAVLNPSRGEIKLLTYITDGAAISTLSAPYILRPDRMSMPSRGFALSANELHTDRYFFYWNKNLSTGKYDGEIVKTNGTNFINDQILNLDLISSDTVGNAIANFLWGLWQNKYVVQECEYVIEDSVSVEKHDIITTLDMLNGDAMEDFFVVSCGFTHESAKLKRRPSVKAKMIRRQ